MKILLVDDSTTIRNIQRDMLHRLGHHEIVEAADGVEALARIAEGPPDLIFLDWNMPNMDGPTFLETLRAQETPQTGHVPVILCTTHGEKPRILRAMQAGADDYIIKPFSIETLAEKIDHTREHVAPTP